MRFGQDSKARDRILQLMKTLGPQTAKELADVLGITSIAVRQHLQGLQEVGLVTHTSKKGQVGRPAHVWDLTHDSEQYFPDRHRDFAKGLLQAMAELHGEEGRRAVIQRWAQRELQHVAAELELDGLDLIGRVRAIVALRQEQGYMAECHEGEGGLLKIIENHCPLGTAACECDDICEGELAVFTDLLGPDALIERSEHLAKGDRRCVYEVRSTTRPD
ncbi:MAG: helix-turn-helix domain-containing protein [Planctomycetes bacterium]|nr:helix-turn-helix domain-containing protein [Planctomycetota bacterium]